MERVAQLRNALADKEVTRHLGIDARPVLDSLGHPHLVSGDIAVVAHLRRKDRTDVAVRIVASQSKTRDWKLRYQALAQLQVADGFNRFPGNIVVVTPTGSAQSHDALFDSAIVAMDWVSGPTLLAAVDMAASAGNRHVLRALATGFIQLWNDAQEVGFVHGDITGQNIMVRSTGQLAMVDLDTASWTDAPFGAMGAGAAGYRHPTMFRDAHHRDAFAALVSIVSLRVLTEAPNLRMRYGDQAIKPNGVFLFREADLGDLAHSHVFLEAKREVSGATTLLLDGLEAAISEGRDALRHALAEIPGMTVPEEMLLDAENEVEGGWDVAPIVARMRAHYSDSWTENGHESNARGADEPTPWPSVPENREWPGHDRGGNQSSDVILDEPEPDRRPGPRSKSSRDIAELRAAASRGDPADVMRLWSILQGGDFGSLVAVDVERTLAATLEHHIAVEARTGNDAAIVFIAEEATGRSIPLGKESRKRIREARERLEVEQELDEALGNDDREQLAELALSGRLAVLGDADRQSLKRVLQAIEIPQMRRAMETGDDLLIVEAMDEDIFDDASGSHAEWIARVALAKQRLDWLGQARQALGSRKSKTLRSLLAEPPPGAIERLSVSERRRIRNVIEGERALAALEASLDRGNDSEVIAALNKIERVGARIPERTMWSRIQQVVERMSVIDSLLEASEATPPDFSTVAHLLPTARAMGLERDPRIGLARMNDLEKMVVRNAHVRRIRSAIARDDDYAIVVAAVPDFHDSLRLLTDEERARVDRAIAARVRKAV